MAVKSLHVLYLGSQSGVDKSLMTFGVGAGEKMRSSFLSFLIQSDEANVLVDTGIHPDDIGLMAKDGPISLTPEDYLPQRLASVGLSMDRIDIVIMTHLHGDHIGWLSQIPNAEVIVQKEEYKLAFDPLPYTRFFHHRLDSPKIKWKLIDMDYQLLPGITLLFTPGHTIGSQSVVIDLPHSGPIIISGDVGFLQENFQKELIPTAFFDSREALLSIKRLNVWSSVKKAPIFTSHDMDYWQNVMIKPPDSYR